jgi:hypothetical protein
MPLQLLNRIKGDRANQHREHALWAFGQAFRLQNAAVTTSESKLIRRVQYRFTRHPTTFASNGLAFSDAYQAPSRHSQENGNKYAPL